MWGLILFSGKPESSLGACPALRSIGLWFCILATIAHITIVCVLPCLVGFGVLALGGSAKHESNEVQCCAATALRVHGVQSAGGGVLCWESSARGTALTAQDAQRQARVLCWELSAGVTVPSTVWY